MVEFCGAECESRLNRYWDEVASEVICSAAKCTPDLRKFGALEKAGALAPYRSPFLDQLAAERDFGEEPMRNPPLLRCLYEYTRKTMFNENFAIEEFLLFERLKDLEIKHFCISSDEWTGVKSALRPFAEQYSKPLGFNSRGGRFRKEASTGLMFEFRIDTGGVRQVGTRIPMEFYIYHVSEPRFFYVSTSFESIIPGIINYARSQSKRGILLGLLSHIEIFDLLLRAVA
jgi:hypothetical protein